MRNFFLTITSLLIAGLLFAQAPKSFKYQAVARNASGNILSEQAISLRISLLQEGVKTVYSELHDVVTTKQGLVNLEIGKGVTEKVNLVK